MRPFSPAVPGLGHPRQALIRSRDRPSNRDVTIRAARLDHRTQGSSGVTGTKGMREQDARETAVLRGHDGQPAVVVAEDAREFASQLRSRADRVRMLRERPELDEIPAAAGRAESLGSRRMPCRRSRLGFDVMPGFCRGRGRGAWLSCGLILNCGSLPDRPMILARNPGPGHKRSGAG